MRLAGEATSADTDKAMVMPAPGAFAIIGVVQKRFSNATQQEIFLTTNSSVPGENVVQVRFFGTKSPTRYGDNTLAYQAISESRIGSELRGTLPGVTMVRSPFITQNSYGVFGYAVGRPSANELCLFAWQQLRAPDNRSAEGTGAIQIRVRLCQQGATEKSLLDFMYGFTIAATVDAPGWNPYGTPPPVDDRLGKSGNPIYTPADAAVLPVTAPQAPAAVASTPARPVVNTVKRRDAVPAEGVSAIVVPSPLQSTAPSAPMATSLPAAGVVVPSPACFQTGTVAKERCP